MLGGELFWSFFSKMRILKDGRILEIVRASVKDTARYTCIARNQAGQTEKNFDLDVQGNNYIKKIFKCLHCQTSDTTADLPHWRVIAS